MGWGVYVYGQAGSKSKRCHTLAAGAHAHAHTRTRLACLLSEAKKGHCALRPVPPTVRYSRYVDQVLGVLYVCRPGIENYDTVSQVLHPLHPSSPVSVLLASCVLGWVI